MTQAAPAASPETDLAALRRLSRALVLQPDFKSALQMMGVHWRQSGDLHAAISAFRRAFALDPDDVNSLAALAHGLKEIGAIDAAVAICAQITDGSPAAGFAAYIRGALISETGDSEAAIAAFQSALNHDPQLRNAHVRLSQLLFECRRFAEARRHQVQAMRLAGDFAETRSSGVCEARILFTCSISGADLPIGFLFDDRRFDSIFTFPADHQGRAIEPPDFDVVFNAIADPDLGAMDLDGAATFLEPMRQPILNPPARVPETRRDRLGARLADIQDVIVPETRRLNAASLEAFAQSETEGVYLLRTAGTHGGDDLARLDDPREALDYLALRKADFYYLTRYVDYRSTDGQFRKYRLIFIDRQVYPYHLAIMDHWKVHYFRADMVQETWKREEEARFLADHRAIFGGAGSSALDKIAQRLDLDYAGIDCAQLGDGRILVFEANPAMLVHLDDSPDEFPYKHQYVPRIREAMTQLILKAAARYGTSPQDCC